jgi:sirohydrochlorin cobaltochelatase
LIEAGATHITVLPMFFGLGRHAREDLPLLIEELQRNYPSVNFVLKPSVGEDATVIDTLAKLALTPGTEVPPTIRAIA